MSSDTRTWDTGVWEEQQKKSYALFLLFGG